MPARRTGILLHLRGAAMKSKTFVMMFVAIGCGLVAAYLTARLTAKGTSLSTIPVLVAKEKIKAGDVIKEPEKLFIEMNYPAGSTPNAISSFEALKNKIINKGLQPGQRLTLAQSLGELRLVLRAHDDEAKVPLQPVENLEWDNGSAEPFGLDKEIFKVAIAKQDMAVGQEVDTPEDFFDIKELPFLPEKAITLDSLGELKGKVVKHPIFKDGFVTAKNF